jgi:hypothetical protein
MAIRQYTDKHCSSCRGTGHISEGKMIDGEWWESFHQCHCVEINIDPETQARIKAALQLAGYRPLPEQSGGGNG